MIATVCLISAAILLFWPSGQPKAPSPGYDRPVAPKAKRPARKRKEAPKNERKN